MIADQVRDALLEDERRHHAANLAGPVLDTQKHGIAGGVRKSDDGSQESVRAGNLALELERLADGPGSRPRPTDRCGMTCADWPGGRRRSRLAWYERTAREQECAAWPGSATE